MIIYLKLFLLLLFVALYALGGQGYRWSKRFVGPAIFGLGIFFTKMSVMSFCGAVGFFLPLILPGYGVSFTQNIQWKKILIRGLHGLANGTPAILFGIAGHNLGFGICQAILAVGASIYFGVFNPFGNTLGNWSTILEDVCLITLATFMIPFLT